jgi:hypothetical protein
VNSVGHDKNDSEKEIIAHRNIFNEWWWYYTHCLEGLGGKTYYFEEPSEFSASGSQ